jgi:PAS domain S-box-containing protein
LSGRTDRRESELPPSDHVAGEAALRALQALIDANDQPVFALDSNLRYTAFNRAHAVIMRALYGCDIAVGGRLPDYQTVAADREAAAANLERALAGEQVTATAFSGEGPQRRSFEVVHTPQADAAGRVVGIVVRARDVTEEAALSQNRTLLAAIVESTSDAVYAKDAAGRYLLFNAAAERVTGKRAEEVLGKDDRFVFPPDEAAAVMAGDRAVMDGAAPATYEETVTDASGGLATFLSTKGPIRGEDGQLLGLFGIARDISERRLAEEHLRESRAQLAATLDSTADGVLAVDNAGRILEVNRRFADLWRVPDDLLAGRDEDALLAFVVDQLADPEAFLGKVRSLRGSDATDVDTLAFKDGRVFERHSSATMQGSVVTGRVWSFGDITERVRGEAELRETRDYLENLFGYANAPVIVWDPELRVTRFNRAFEELTQRAADEVIGRHLELLFPEDERRREALAHVTQASAGERWQVVEIPILRADGEVRTVLWNSATVFAADGETPVATIAQGQDVTERIAAEQALRESEDTFKYIFDYSPLGKSITLPTGEIHVNRAFCQMLGYAQAELEQARWQDITHSDDVALTQKFLDPVLSGLSDKARFVKRYRHKDGSIVWADVATSLRRDDAGQPLFFVTAVNDITEQRLAQDSLRSSEERYRELVDHMTSGVVVYEPTAGEDDFIMREFNIAAQEIEQLDRDEVVGRPVTDAFPGVEEFGLLAVLRRVARTGEPEEFPTAFYQDRRLASWRENHIYRLPTGEVVAVYEDVTERVRAEREAAHAKELMERAEEIGHAGGWEYDVAAERVTWTDEVYRIHGLGPDYDPNDAGRDIDFYSPEDSTLVAEAFRKAVEEGEAYDLEAELDRADGFRIWVRTIGRPVVEDGAVVRVLGNIMDISERMRAEAEVLRLNAELEQRVADRTAQLEAVNKELEAFAYSVSHDLRAPLRHISGYASILATDAAGVLDDDGRHCLDTISESVREMGVLIDDLLQFSRIGRAEMAIGPVDMERVLAEALRPIREEAVDRTIEWSIGPLPPVTGDPALLRQVWANLLGNAVKYSRDRDPARIDVGASDGDHRSADDAATEDVFFVRDNGVGFDMQYAHKLFGVFQRLHSSAQFEGTGIGLANVERIVTRHGGRVWAEAEPDKGATFYFALPRPKENRW